jgi:hypothetical protein
MAVQRLGVARLREATAAARFCPPDDFGREPEDFFAAPPAAFFPPDAADVLPAARDSFFAAVFDAVAVFVARALVLEADRPFALEAPFRERAAALVSPFDPLSCCALPRDGALGKVEGSAGEVAAGAAWRLSNRSRTTLCARFCLLRACRISSPCRSRPATL